ncbi:MAG: LemA family protein [Kiritimatiellia bacterium]
MKKVLVTIAIIVGVIAVSVMWSIGVRNGLIDADESVAKTWKDIGVQLERRADLVPNLVNTVKGYATHEKEIFTAVAEARAKLIAAKSPAEKAAADGSLNSALGRLLAISENYPALKADSAFLRLQDELAGTENRIAVTRTRYNDAVKSFNVSIRKFPGSLFASGLGFAPKEYYEVAEGKAVATPPTVQF